MKINSPKYNQSGSTNSNTFQLPKRRSTRLKSEIFVEAFKTEFIDKEQEVNLNSSDLKFQPLKNKTKLSKANSNNLESKILNSTDPVQEGLSVKATKNTNDTKRDGKVNKKIDRMTDRLIKNLTTAIDDKPSKQKNQMEFEHSNSKRRKKQSSVDRTLDKALNNSADQTSPLQGKRTRRSTGLLDTPPTNNIKVIKIESSRQSIDIKLNGNERDENLPTKSLDRTLKVIIPKLSLTKNSNVMQDNKVLEHKRKFKREISKEFSYADTLLEREVKSSPLKRKCISVNTPKIVQPKRLNRTKKDTEITEISKKVLRSNNASDVHNLQDPQAIEKHNNPSKKQKSIETFDNSFSTKKDLNNETKISQPNKKGKPLSSKQWVRKLNSTKPSQMQSTKLSKLTKEQLKNANTRKIPKNFLDDVLDMIDNDDHTAWEDRNISCHPSIHTYWETSPSFTSDQNMKLKYARQFLLRRDWISLSKVLCLSNSTAKTYYPLLSKYAALLLAYTDKEQFNKFVQFSTSITDSSSVLKKCTKISRDKE